MKSFSWNNEIEFKYYDSYTGDMSSKKDTLKGILKDDNILPQDKLAVIVPILVELMNQAEEEDYLDQFEQLLETTSL